MRLYAYCLSEEATPETLEGVAGVDGVRPRLIRKGALALVVSEFEGERVAVTRENVRAHGRVIASVMRQATPLPFRFGTVAAEERLGNYLRTHEGALRASLVRVRGCVEMSVKIIWDAGAVRREVEEIGEEARAVGVGRGAAFLAAKQRELSGDEKLKERAEALAARLEARVADVVRESSVSVSVWGRPLVFDR